MAGDPVSAFGGVLITNKTIDLATATEINKLFCEVVIAPGYDAEALTMLQGKKNRIILVQRPVETSKKQFRSILNGVLEQDKDARTADAKDFTTSTKKEPTVDEVVDLEFANKLVKHTKSNTIVFAKNEQLLANTIVFDFVCLLASGLGQTSRVDALNQAIVKAKAFGFDLTGAVMASDAFFPFPDCVEIAKNAGISAVVQPGGSIKDQLSIDYCDANDMAMVMTGIRHFRH